MIHIIKGFNVPIRTRALQNISQVKNEARAPRMRNNLGGPNSVSR